MFIIFGLRNRTAVLATLSLACRNGHVAAHRIFKVTRWFTLFFVPLIPFSKKYRSVCIQCGLTLDIPKAVAEETASKASTGAQPSQEPITPPLPSAPSTGVSAAISPAGWYPDPSGSGARRYWDGHGWTEAVQQS